jgi:hypothetical protein
VSGLRNQASPSRLVKLYEHMSAKQRAMVEDVNFGGLLQIACHTSSADLANGLSRITPSLILWS